MWNIVKSLESNIDTLIGVDDPVAEHERLVKGGAQKQKDPIGDSEPVHVEETGPVAYQPGSLHYTTTPASTPGPTKPPAYDTGRTAPATAPSKTTVASNKPLTGIPATSQRKQTKAALDDIAALLNDDSVDLDNLTQGSKQKRKPEEKAKPTLTPAKPQPTKKPEVPNQSNATLVHTIRELRSRIAALEDERDKQDQSELQRIAQYKKQGERLLHVEEENANLKLALANAESHRRSAVAEVRLLGDEAAKLRNAAVGEKEKRLESSKLMLKELSEKRSEADRLNVEVATLQEKLTAVEAQWKVDRDNWAAERASFLALNAAVEELEQASQGVREEGERGIYAERSARIAAERTAAEARDALRDAEATHATEIAALHAAAEAATAEAAQSAADAAKREATLRAEAAAAKERAERMAARAAAAEERRDVRLEMEQRLATSTQQPALLPQSWQSRLQMLDTKAVALILAVIPVLFWLFTRTNQIQSFTP